MQKVRAVPQTLLAGALLFSLIFTVSCGKKESDAPKESPATSSKSAADLEKEKAMKNPYPNDLGPDTIDVSKYSAAEKEGYELMRAKCAVCHTAARPLNSQFVQLKESEQAAEKKVHPEVFKNKLVWQVESKIWQRYVKRMMAKPGCNIKDAEGKKIFKFLLADSKRRKTGAMASKWGTQRKKMLKDFKAKYPDRYKDLFETH